MRKLLYLFLLFSTAIVAKAQPSGEGNEEIQSEYRQKIGIDYSMPDFSTSSLDESVIGTRLAKMLKVLKKTFEKTPLAVGELIHLDAWKQKEAWGKPGVMENWMESYHKI